MFGWLLTLYTQFWWLQKAARVPGHGSPPWNSCTTVRAARGCPVNPKQQLHLPQFPRKQQEKLGSRWESSFCLLSQATGTLLDQGRGSARSLQCPDSFLTSCNCFPATTLLSRELLAKAICSPSIFISCCVHAREGKQRGRRRTNRAGICSRERWEGFGSSARQDMCPDHHSKALCSPLQPTSSCSSLSDSFGVKIAVSQGLHGGSEPPLLGSSNPCRLLPELL